MPRQAISVTLGIENLTWLRGRVGAGSARSVSDLLDQLVTAARRSGQVVPPRSVVGTITIDPSDPTLEGADAAVRSLFERSIVRPMMVRERRARFTMRRRPPARRG